MWEQNLRTIYEGTKVNNDGIICSSDNFFFVCCCVGWIYVAYANLIYSLSFPLTHFAVDLRLVVFRARAVSRIALYLSHPAEEYRFCNCKRNAFTPVP